MFDVGTPQPTTPSVSTSCHRGIFDIRDEIAALAYQPTLTYAPLRDGIWTVSDEIYRTIFLETTNGLVAFDTFYSPGAATAYRKALNRIFPRKPIHTIIYSHDHLDHTGYALDLAPRADVIAHELCAEVIAARESDGQTLPTETWSGERITYDLDGCSFELVYPGRTHGNGNIAAWFPDSQLLFMVDTAAAGVGYTFLPDWHLGGYLPTMRRLLELEWDTFVPGHFWPLDRQGVEESLAWYEAVEHCAHEALAAGVDPDDYGDVADFTRRRLEPQHDNLFRFYEYAPLNLMRYLAHLRTGAWGLEDNGPVEQRPLA